MKGRLHCVNYYNLALMAGCAHGFAQEGGLLRMRGPDCAYITPMTDGADPGMTWHRLVLDGDFEGCKLEVIAAATDGGLPQGEWEAEAEAYFSDPAVPPQEKAGRLLAMGGIRLVGFGDLLLHDLTGRYLWVYVRLLEPGQSGELRGLRVDLPKSGFIDYFPEHYSEAGSFFERYLAIFQSMFLDLEAKVAGVPAMLDYRAAPDAIVESLAGWAGIGNRRGLLNPAQLRAMLERIDLFQGKKGTPEAMAAVVELVTGVRPVIAEQFRFAGGGHARFYGEAPGDFAVILSPGDTAVRHEALKELIDEYSPIGTRGRVILLERGLRSDMHCYLGINSVISIPGYASTEGFVLGDNISVG